MELINAAKGRTIMAPDTDEQFACRLLREYLTKERALGFHCAVNPADPPDLIVTWTNGVQWGVEVTRTYLQVPSFNGTKLVSSKQIHAQLERFAEQIKKKTKGIRQRSYTLFLEGPGRFSSLKKPMCWKEWEEEVENAIWEHIVSKTSSPLRLPGVWLQPSEPGQRFSILLGGGGAQNIGSATEQMFQKALQNKSKALFRWNGSFAERWLLLLNRYPLGDDQDQRDILNRMARKDPAVAEFNGIFWRGCSGGPLIRLSLC